MTSHDLELPLDLYQHNLVQIKADLILLMGGLTGSSLTVNTNYNIYVLGPPNCEYGFYGAGFQWWYPNFCPAFVLCLAFVQHMSSICLNFVLVKHLSNICPKKPTFVLRKSNICPHSPTYVLILSSVLAKIHPKIGGQNLVISWT